MTQHQCVLVYRTGPKSNYPTTYHSWNITLRCLETSGFDDPLIQRHIPPKPKPQLHRCENLKFGKGRHWSTDCYSAALTGLTHSLLQPQICCFKANDQRARKVAYIEPEIICGPIRHVFTMKVLLFSGTPAFFSFRFSV